MSEGKLHSTLILSKNCNCLRDPYYENYVLLVSRIRLSGLLGLSTLGISGKRSSLQDLEK